MTKDAKASTKGPLLPAPIWEEQLKRLDARLAASGRKVEVEELSESSTFHATFVPKRRGRARARHLAVGEALREAYRRTVYSFECAGEIVEMRIGQANAAVAALLVEAKAKGAAFVTACNPPFLPVGSPHNRMATRHLKYLLTEDPSAKTWTTLPGKGEAPDGSWPAEPSYLIVGISQADAVQLGRTFGQNAIVWVDQSGMPSLLELTDFAGRLHARRKTPYFTAVHLSVPWGYDMAEIAIRPAAWRRILEGEGMGLGTWGHNDGERFRLWWNFNGTHLEVSYGDDGGSAYEGPLTGAHLRLPEPARVPSGARG